MLPIVLITCGKGVERAKGLTMNSLLKIGLMSTWLLMCGQLAATELDEFSVLMLGPLDGRAVVKLPDGKMQVIGNGQTLPGTQAIVKQILNDRLVLEETVAGDTPEVQSVWLYKAAHAGETSRVQRLQKTPPSRALQKLTVVKELEKDK
jgi:hypothetical protein